MLDMQVEREDVGYTILTGSLTRQSESILPVSDIKPHLVNIGKFIEDMEIDMRSNLNELYVLKTREVINSIRKLGDGPNQTAAHVANLTAAVAGHGKTRKVDSES